MAQPALLPDPACLRLKLLDGAAVSHQTSVVGTLKA